MNFPKDKKTQVILIIAVAVCVGVGIWLGIIGSRNRVLQGSGARLRKAEDRLADAQRWVKNAEAIEGELEAALKSLEEMEAQMPKAGDDLFARSYALLDRAKAGHDVGIREVTRPEKKEGERKQDIGLLTDFPYDACVFSVSGMAHYHDFGKFLADFENNHPFCRVQNVVLGPLTEPGVEGTAAQTGKEKLTFRMDVIALIKPNP
jgi:hypothetical protein